MVFLAENCSLLQLKSWKTVTVDRLRSAGTIDVARRIYQIYE